MRKKTTLTIVLALLTGLCCLTTGCRSKKALSRGDVLSPSEQETESGATVSKPKVVDTLQAVQCHYYTANFSCTVHDINVTGQIRIVNDSAIWVSVNKIIEVGRGLLTPARVRGYIKLANRFIDCGWGDVQRRWGVEIDYATAQALLFGNPPPKLNGRKVKLWCDKTLKRPAHGEITTTSGQRISYLYEKMESVNGQLFPSTISVDIKTSKFHEATTLKLERITLEHSKEMPFSVPKSYRPL